MSDDTTAYAAFSSALSAARDADVKNGWAVTPQTEEELAKKNGVTLISTESGAGAYVTPDGDIEGVFRNPELRPNGGALRTILPLAIEAGGRKLDCYGPGLARAYSKFGFVPVARTEFNPEFANPGWTPDKGQPDIYFMMYTGPANADAVVDYYGSYPALTADQLDALPLMDYDAAAAYRDGRLAENNIRGKSDRFPEKFSAGANPLAAETSDTDAAYIQAVESGDVDTARKMFIEQTLLKAKEGITPFLYVGGYHSEHHKRIARAIKTGDADAIAAAANEMVDSLPKDTDIVLVPMPSRTGRATDTLLLANKLSELSGAPVMDVLRGKERPPPAVHRRDPV